MISAAEPPRCCWACALAHVATSAMRMEVYASLAIGRLLLENYFTENVVSCAMFRGALRDEPLFVDVHNPGLASDHTEQLSAYLTPQVKPPHSAAMPGEVIVSLGCFDPLGGRGSVGIPLRRRGENSSRSNCR